MTPASAVAFSTSRTLLKIPHDSSQDPVKPRASDSDTCLTITRSGGTNNKSQVAKLQKCNPRYVATNKSRICEMQSNMNALFSK